MALLGAAVDSIGVGERTLFEQLLGRLTSDMLLSADRGFPSYDLYTASAATGAQLLWRVSDSFTLPVKKRLDDGTYLSELRGKRARERVTVRVIGYSVADDEGVCEVFALITTLLDPERAPAIEARRVVGLPALGTVKAPRSVVARRRRPVALIGEPGPGPAVLPFRGGQPVLLQLRR
jgi:hypothetical protein